MRPIFFLDTFWTFFRVRYENAGQPRLKVVEFTRESWSGRPGSNRRRPAWEAGILPLNYARSERSGHVSYMELRHPCQ